MNDTKLKKPLLKRLLFVISNPKIYVNLFFYHLKIFFEKIRGVDFTKIEQANQLNFVGTKYNGYWSSNNKYLDKLLKSFKISSKDSIVDIGCGKAEVLLKFEKYGFGRVSGIELTEKLFKIAQKNMVSLGKNNIEIFNSNAIEFKNYDSYNYFYLYNPFQEDIMREVISKIENSLIEKPRHVTLIYKNPVCHKVVIENSVFKKSNEFKTEIKDIPFYIYSN